MELTSLTFFAALSVLFSLFWLSPRRFQPVVLLLGSYFFYALWDLRFILVLLGSTALDFSLGLFMEKTRTPNARKWLLAASLASNLGILVYFKYSNFLFGAYFLTASKLGLPVTNAELNPFIPLGVSFYTFHSISYIMDIYRGKIPASRSFVEYALFVSFFPKLISGPIERAENFLQQIRMDRFIKLEDVFQALKLILYGLFLKLCISDRLHYVTEKMFGGYELASSAELWLGYYAYSFQIYADFFGYTLIARGVAWLFGIRLSENFVSPYLAASPQEFWRRWHVTLSTWFRDYVYIPLGGSRRRIYFNIAVTMTLAGLWHGADYKFLFWGFYHGLLLCFQKLLFGDQKNLNGWKRILGIPITFHLVSFGWLFFKAPDISTAFAYSLRMLEAPAGMMPVKDSIFIWSSILLGAWLVCFALFRITECFPILQMDKKLHYELPLRGAYLGFMLLVVILLGVTNAEPFVYFYF